MTQLKKNTKGKTTVIVSNIQSYYRNYHQEDLISDLIFHAPIKYLILINIRSLPICNQLHTGIILEP